jgi:hypothetical protein
MKSALAAMPRIAWIPPLALAFMAGAATADVVDLSVNSSGTVNGAIFERFSVRPAGTGVIDSFVRIQAQGNATTQQGYNTSGRPAPFDANQSPVFTRNLQLGEIFSREVDGVGYYEFLLDINEPASGENRFLSLDQLQIYTSPTGGQTTTNLSELGELVYALNAGGSENWVKLDANLTSGSGESDMRLLVPVAAFGAAGPNTFVYLYSSFGERFAAQGGFEEWGTIIPLPPSVSMGAVCLVGIGLVRLIRRRNLD